MVLPFDAAGSGGGVNLGSAYAIIEIRDEIRTGMARAEASLDNGLQRMGQRISQWGGSLSNLGGALTTLTAPVLAFGTVGVHSAMNFETALTEIQARAGLTADEMERVRQKALDIGRDTQFSAGQGADAFLQLLTSGQSVEEAFATIDSVIQGAAASGENLGFVSDGLTDIMAAMGLSAGDAAKVLQALVAAEGASSATFADMIYGFQNVGGMARNFGLTVEDTAAVLAIFSENGIKGAEAGTQLRSMLNNMSRDTTEVQETWAALGVSLYDSAGNARNLEAVINDLRAAMAGMTDQERITTIQNLAGSFGQLGLTALLSGGNISDMETQMRGSASAADLAAARAETFQGKLDFLRGSVETFAINTLTPFMNNTLGPFIGQISDVVNGLSDWAVQNPETANEIVKLIAVLGIAGPLVWGLGQLLSAVGTIIGVAGGAVGLIGSIGGLIAAIGLGPLSLIVLLGTLIGLIATDPEAVITVLKKASDAAGRLAEIGLAAMRRALNDIAAALSPVLEGLERLGLASKGGQAGRVVSGVGEAFQTNDLFRRMLTDPEGAAQSIFNRTVGNISSADIAAWTNPNQQQPWYQNNLQYLAQLAMEAMQGRDDGGRGMAGQAYMIGTGAQPEVFVPGSNGTFIPNADQMGGVNIQNLTIHANSRAEGQAAADGFAARLEELRRFNG